MRIRFLLFDPYIYSQAIVARGFAERLGNSNETKVVIQKTRREQGIYASCTDLQFVLTLVTENL